MTPEEDARIFGEAFRLYNDHRWKELATVEDWTALADALIDFANKNKWQENPLAERLTYMLFDVFNDLYKGGKTPPIPDYFGRSDL